MLAHIHVLGERVSRRVPCKRSFGVRLLCAGEHREGKTIVKVKTQVGARFGVGLAVATLAFAGLSGSAFATEGSQSSDPASVVTEELPDSELSIDGTEEPQSSDEGDGEDVIEPIPEGADGDTQDSVIAPSVPTPASSPVPAVEPEGETETLDGIEQMSIGESYSGIFSKWTTVGKDYWNGGAPGADAPPGAADGGKLLHNIQGHVVVGVDLKVPDTATAGDTLELGINTDNYTFKSFSNEEIDADGVDVGSMSATKSKLTITFGSGVDTHHGVTAHIEFSVLPVASRENRYDLPVQFTTPNGTVLKTGSSYNVYRHAPNITGMLGTAGVTAVNGKNELFVEFMPQYRDIRASNAGKPLDPASIRFVVVPETEGMTPLPSRCGVEKAPLEWLYSDGWNTPVSTTQFANTACQKDGTVVVTLPAGIQVPTTNSAGEPELVRGVRVRVPYVVDRPEYDYTAKATISGNAVGAPLQDMDIERTIQSIKLEGQGAGTLRPGSIEISKKADQTTNVVPGEETTYKIVVKNTNEAIGAYGVVVTDTMPAELSFVSASDGGKHSKGVVVWPEIGYLAPGDSVTYTVTAKVGIDAIGKIKNIVTAEGENVCTEPEDEDCTDDEIIATVDPEVDLVKSSTVEDTNENGFIGDAGDTIVYSFLVQNTGKTVIKSAKLNDTFLGISDYECLVEPLAAGAEIPCVDPEDGAFSHVITEAEGEAGSVYNEATLTVPGLPEVPSEVITPAYKPGIDLDKNVVEVLDTNKNGVLGDPGDTIVYSFLVVNTGNSVIESALLNDALLEIEGYECLTEPLAVGAETFCADPEDGAFSHVITKAEGEAGSVHNVATVTTPGAEATDEATVDAEATPAPNGETPGNLAKTGANGLILAAIGLGVSGVGGALLYGMRRRVL